MRPDQRRIEYAGSVHDEEEIEAVVEVLRGGASALRIGKNVKAFEQGVAEHFGKRRGIMCNSGSSAFYLAVELLDLEPGDEVITSAVTFSTDVAPLVRAGIVPAFVDVEPDTFNIDVAGIEAMISPRTKAILAPNLIGNAPDWDRIRAIADAHGLKVIEDSCDALGATLRGTPTGTRSDISVTSFALAHIITAAGHRWDGAPRRRRTGSTAACSCAGGGAARNPSSSGRRRATASSSPTSTASSTTTSSSSTRSDGTSSRARSARRSGTCSSDELPANLARRQRNFDVLSAFFGTYPDVFTLPRQLEGLETGWHMFPILLRPESGIRRGDFQEHMEGHGIDTRMVWTGNVTRQPAFADVAHRVPGGGLPNADRVMEQGLILPSNHGLDDDDLEYLCVTAGKFLKEHGFAPAGVAS